MRYYFLCFLLIPHLAFCQDNSPENSSFDKTKIDKSIFRVMVPLSTPGSIAFTGCYEHEIKRPLTVLLQAGPSFSSEELWTDNLDNGQYPLYLQAVASVEVRYYFNLNRRIKHEKITRNFSAGYLSIEPYVQSKGLVILNRTGEKGKPANTGAFINIGFQKQANETTCYGAFFGTRFPGKVYSNSVDFTDLVRGGITIGRVF